MKHVQRLLLLFVTLLIGGILGYMLLPEFELIKMILFVVVCLALGEFFYRIDKKISKQ